MPLGKLKKYLDDNKIKYVIKSHSIAYTTPEIAAIAHIPGKEWAKTVIIKIDGKMAMAVLPASYRIDFDDFKKAVGEKKIELATEEEFQSHFTDCDNEITFNACSHNELLQMAYKDFEKLVNPKVVKFSYQY
jgi:Ala-tRNA(Pro) deacylase